MTVTASGPITFSNIMNEFNSGGGQSNIKLGDYLGRYPDNFGGIQEESLYVTWNGTGFTVNGLAASFAGTNYRTYPGKLRLRFLLNSTVNVPFYVSTTNNTTGSNLASGVTNNGAVYSSTGNYSFNNFTHVICDLDTAAGGTNENLTTNIVYLNTNTQQTSSGQNTVIAISSMPDTNRLVTYNRPYVDITPSASYAGGSESVKAGGGTYYSTNVSPQRNPGIIKNGTSLTVNFTLQAFPSIFAGGTAPSLYIAYFYPITYSNTGLAMGWSTGNYIGFFIYPYSGSGGNFINGGPNSSGNKPNTGTGIADYMRQGSMAIDNSFGSGSSSGWSFSAGGSGATLALTVTNNSGTDHYWNPYINSNAGSTYQPFYMQYSNSGNNPATTISSNWGSNMTTQHYGQNSYPSIRFGRKDSSDNTVSDFSMSLYQSASVNRNSVLTNYSNIINTGSLPSYSTSFPGGNVGSGTGTIWSWSSYYPYVYKDYPSTGTMRLRSRVALGGTYLATTNALGPFSTIDVTPGYDSSLGGSNETATFSYSTGSADLADNAAVKNIKRSMKLSHYYGTKNLGTDGG
tara:strand:- start:522 stop:2231 length:1710 start_codon:yes stop_codon:yes gene_type:complete